MNSVKVTSDWEHPSIEENYGHTQSEWGKFISKNKKYPSIIYAYKMKLETNGLIQEIS